MMDSTPTTQRTPSGPSTPRRGDAAAATPAASANDFLVSAPTLSLPKGGGAIKGIGEKFSANPVTGTGSMAVPIATSPGRGGFGPQLSLSYDSGAGNGPFGLGWNLSLPAITRKTDKGLPRYFDNEESDVFILSGAEDLVPLLDDAGQRPPPQEVVVYDQTYRIAAYRPRIEGLFACIERWTDVADPGNVFWRSISRDNITTWYGRNPDSRIADPDQPTRIFEWRICQSYDDKGNVIEYEYGEDDPANLDTTSVWEANRTAAQRIANRYPKQIRYGNAVPFLPKLEATGDWPDPAAGLAAPWMFLAVFDYGDPAIAPGNFARDMNAIPQRRADAFSNHRAGFEVRCHRLCSRVLMFHHFPGELGPEPVLVRSTDFGYSRPVVAETVSPLKAGYTVLRSVTQRGYQRKPGPGEYASSSLPPVTYSYSEPVVDQTLRAIASKQLENLPVGTQGPGYQWIDLDGEGLSGVLSEQQGAWYYKPNLGDCTFGPMRLVGRQPAMAQASGSRHQFLDLAGDGEIDVVDFGGPTPGFHERDRDEGWKRHVPFASLPNIDWQDPNLRFVDLTGDGHADALITEGEVFTWYPSLDERGFAASERSPQPADEDAGPRLVFADGTQTIFLADMRGDGLTDLVRIRNGEVCYWPNLGYGRFGRKVSLGNSPRFDHADLFDPHRIRLADIDGSGPVDLIYLGRDGARLYFNRSGNSLSDPLIVNLPVATDNLGAVQVADLLGNGTACLVWNSHLPADAAHPVRYVDLMGGQKPHLLIKIDNNLGATTTIEYAPSTRFYLQDQASGRPWITRLSFPVHCVSRVTVEDKWRETRFTSTFSYHHGYFDGIEREFRGFGRVEQIDTEHFDDPALDQAPVKTVTWYHTGAALDRQRILGQFAGEYFPAGYTVSGDFHEKALSEPELPADLTAEEWREALRACKGMVLRQEVFELAPASGIPTRIFTAAFHNCRIQRLQRQAGNRHAVFLVSESEALSYHYELALPAPGSAQEVRPDPRISHTLNLRHDKYGNLQQAVAIGYGRWEAGNYAPLPNTALIASVQGEMHVAYTETRYTNDCVIAAGAGASSPVRHYRLRHPFEALSYELKGIPKAGDRYYALADFLAHDLSESYGHAAGETPPPRPVQLKQYHEWADGSIAQRRLVEHARTRYFDDANDAAPPTLAFGFGQLGPRGLKFEDYKLALTDELLAAIFGGNDDRLGWEVEPAQGATPARTARDLLDDPKIGGYWPGPRIGMHPGQYWMRSGTAGFASEANEHFFLPERYIDPFGNETALDYDSRDLFVWRSRDAKGNTVAIAVADGDPNKPRFDYRVLAPIEMVDINGNYSEVRFDILGRVIAVATKGKFIANAWQGDNLDAFGDDLVNPPAADVIAFCSSTRLAEDKARSWLAHASSRIIYHFGEAVDGSGQIQWATRPAGACAIAREIRASQPGGNASPLQVSLECSDGVGNVLMKKQQAEPESVGGPLRWIVNGLTVLNNKGKPVKQYEPAFSEIGFGCEPLLANGVTPLIHYDALGRVVRTDMPDGTFSRAEFSPWHVKTWDQNDTVRDSAWYASRNAIPPENKLPIDARGVITADPEQRAGWLAARHADTPSLTLLDSLGRDVIAVAHNRVEDPAGKHTFDGRQWKDEFYPTFTKLDAEGKPLWIRDARDNLVMQYINPPRANKAPGDEMPANAVPCYDIAGNLLFQHSMDAGDRWMLMDAAGKPMLAWDLNDKGAGSPIQKRLYRTEYDALHRPTAQRLKIDAAAPALIEAFMYCDTSQPNLAGGLLDAMKYNLIGQAIKHWDPSGKATVESIDLSGKPAHITRTLILPDADGGTGLLRWDIDNRDSLLETETFHQLTEYDALGRMTTLHNWHRLEVARIAIYLPTYNRRGLLESEDLVTHATSYDKGSGTSTPAIKKITYNEKGQKLTLELGNGTTTTYSYDHETYRLSTLETARGGGALLQNLSYTYDPVGNITHIEDVAQDTVFTNNSMIEPKHEYTYDALYRLIEASGRENPNSPVPPAKKEGTWPPGSFATSDVPRNYRQSYIYDAVGNFVQMRHFAAGATQWVRDYRYAFNDPTQQTSNRLWQTTIAGDTTTYRHDSHGNMLNLNQTPEDWGVDIRWDWRDMIRGFDAIGGGIARYHYGIDKQRTRKYITRNPTAGGTITEDRIYLGGYELYRRRNPQNEVVEEIESLHLFEGEQRVLLVDDVITSSKNTQHPRPDGLTVKPQTLFRYQYSNHLGSASLELDEQAEIISYEEYHPYGTSAYRLMKSEVEAPAKRYRYTGMERDEESGLGYHTARYYLSWLGRWGSSDPSGIKSGSNLFAYANAQPINLVDKTGLQPAGRLDVSQRTALLKQLEPIWNEKGLSSLDVNDDAQLIQAYQWFVVGSPYTQATEDQTNHFLSDNRETRFQAFKRTAGHWFATSWLAKKLSSGAAVVSENVEVQTKAFDNAAGEITAPMAGGSRPVDSAGVGGRINADVRKAAIETTGPSVRHGLAVAFEAATIPGDINVLVSLISALSYGLRVSRRTGMVLIKEAATQSLKGGKLNKLGYEFEGVAKTAMRDVMQSEGLANYYDDGGKYVLRNANPNIDKVSAVPEAVLHGEDGSLRAVFDAKMGGIDVDQGMVYVDHLALDPSNPGALIYVTPEGTSAIPRVLQDYADSKGVEIMQWSGAWSPEYLPK